MGRICITAVSGSTDGTQKHIITWYSEAVPREGEVLVHETQKYRVTEVTWMPPRALGKSALSPSTELTVRLTCFAIPPPLPGAARGT